MNSVQVLQLPSTVQTFIELFPYLGSTEVQADKSDLKLFAALVTSLLYVHSNNQMHFKSSDVINPQSIADMADYEEALNTKNIPKPHLTF